MRVVQAILLLLIVSACSMVAPEIAQLENYNAALKEGRLRDIANTPVVASCTAEKEPCGRLHAIRGQACLDLAMADRSRGAVCPGASPAVTSDLACADDGFAKATASASAFSVTDQQKHRQNRAQVLYCRAEQASVADGATFAREALQLARSLPPPGRDTIGGSAALFLSIEGAGSDPARCDAVREAATRARQGLAANPRADDRTLLSRLAADAERQRRSIPGCRS